VQQRSATSSLPTDAADFWIPFWVPRVRVEVVPHHGRVKAGTSFPQVTAHIRRPEAMCARRLSRAHTSDPWQLDRPERAAAALPQKHVGRCLRRSKA